ncbi:MAG: Do family serine endopeptidase, partial [Pseudomonadota bacterium]
MHSTFKKRLRSTSIAAGFATAFLAGGLLVPSHSVLAEAVRVEAPKAPSFADVVEAVSPAVVSVRVKSTIRPASNRGARGFGVLPEDHPFRRFFGPDGFDREFGERGPRRFERREDRRSERRRGPGRSAPGSQGSGFFVSDDGYIVTNNHVVRNGSSYEVVLNDGTQLEAKLIGTDPKTDLAVLKVEPTKKFTYVSFAKQKSRVGEWVVAVGNPFGLGGTVTAGIVSASGRDIGSGPYDDFIQIDAAVNKGNSGGPAFNLNGEVIGVNTAIFSPSGGNVGIAFAISAATTEQVVADLIKSGSVTRGWLGVQIQPVTDDIAESLGLEKASGTIVAGVQDGSPAEKDGLRSGDVIQQVDGKEVKGPKELARLIASYEPAETAKITVFRGGSTVDVSVTLGQLPGEPAKVAMTDDRRDGRPVDLDQLGLAIERGDDGVVVADVMPGGSAEEKGIRPGDVIVSINGKDTASVNDVGAAVAEAMEQERKSVLLQVRRDDRNRFVALP